MYLGRPGSPLWVESVLRSCTPYSLGNGDSPMPETKRRLKVSPSLVISILALVIAMSSGAYAAVTIAEKNSVVSKSIKNGQVKAKDLANNSVRTAKIKDGQVTSADIADGQVTSADIGD